MTARAGRLLLPLALPVLLLALWWVLSEDSDSIYFPPLRELLDRFAEDWFGENLSRHVIPSVARLAAGFAIAVVVGIALGTIMGLSDRVRRDLRPLTEYFRATPAVALIPLAFILMGPGAKMEIAIIAFACTWPIVVATTDGVRATEPIMIETGMVYGLTPAQRVRYVVVPAALPPIMAGIRVAVQFAVGMMILANFVGSDRGLGFFVLDAQTTFNVKSTWGGLFIIGLVGFVVTLPVMLAERRLLRWHRGWRASVREAGA